GDRALAGADARSVRGRAQSRRSRLRVPGAGRGSPERAASDRRRRASNRRALAAPGSRPRRPLRTDAALEPGARRAVDPPGCARDRLRAGDDRSSGGRGAERWTASTPAPRAPQTGVSAMIAPDANEDAEAIRRARRALLEGVGKEVA